METITLHFYLEALAAKMKKAKAEVVNAAMRTAMELAEKLAPYRHPKYAAIKVTGDPANPLHVNADASSEEIRTQIIERLIKLAPVLELEAVPELEGTAIAEIASAELTSSVAALGSIRMARKSAASV